MPDAFPQGGFNATTWVPTPLSSKEEFIKVKFPQQVNAAKIFVAESYNPGTIKTIHLYDTEGKEYLVKEFAAPDSLRTEPDIYAYDIDKTDYPVSALKLTLFKNLMDSVAIDAIGISEKMDIQFSKKDIKVETADTPMQYYEKECLPYTINSSLVDDILPVLSPDGKRLYFSRRLDPDNAGGQTDKVDIWYVDKSEEKWQEAKHLEASINNSGANFLSSITDDGSTYLLGNVYERNEQGSLTMKRGVSQATFDGNEWSQPEEVEIDKFYTCSSKANFNLSRDGTIMIMSIFKCNDTFGGRDLYVSFKTDSSWTAPKNLGEMVNTPSNDVTPYLAADNKTLYFSTRGYPGYGLKDVFVTKRTGDGWDNWTKPENLGAMVNSAKDDTYFTYPTDSDYAYFVTGEESKQADICSIRIKPKEAVIAGTVTDKVTGEAIASAKVEIPNSLFTDTAGKYKVELVKRGNKYIYTFSADGYKPEIVEIDVKDKFFPDTVYVNVALCPEDITVPLDDVYFDVSRYNLLPATIRRLDEEYGLMVNKYKGANFIIEGHTSSTGGYEYNVTLANNRAKAIYDYFVSKGMEASRLKYEGFGPSRPVASNDTAEGRRLNRRVHIIVSQPEDCGE